jgi:hypothetical protein
MAALIGYIGMFFWVKLVVFAVLGIGIGGELGRYLSAIFCLELLFF